MLSPGNDEAIVMLGIELITEHYGKPQRTSDFAAKLPVHRGAQPAFCHQRRMRMNAAMQRLFENLVESVGYNCRVDRMKDDDKFDLGIVSMNLRLPNGMLKFNKAKHPEWPQADQPHADLPYKWP